MKGAWTMSKAAQIMDKKKGIKEEAEKHLTREESNRMWSQATERLDNIFKKYADIPSGEHTHTDAYIFPSAAIYLTAKEYMDADKAYSLIENTAIRNTESIGRKLGGFMKIPFMRSIFIRMWDPMTKKMFGSESGFKNRFYPKKRGEYRMDILACPYCRYFTELGCPELTKIFCENDERSYGSLPGLEFIRTMTLGKGGDRCDFYIRRTK